jgi:Protein of unknown function (DUF3800)
MYSIAEHIAKAVWLSSYHLENILVLLSAYFDDSGTDSGNSSLVIAGFASTVEQWILFDRDWLEAQTDFGAPPFHAKFFDDARRGHGPYKTWPEAKRRDYLDRLLGIISRRTRKSFATILSKDDFEAVVSANSVLCEYYYAPFTFSCVNCIHQVCDWRNEYYGNTPLGFFFDEGHKNIGQLREVAKRALLRSDFMIERVTSGDDETLPPLQAADLLAFELCSESRAVEKGSRRYSRYPLQRLDEHPHEWLKVTQKRLLETISERIADGTFVIDGVK